MATDEFGGTLIEEAPAAPSLLSENLLTTVKDLEGFTPRAAWDFKQHSIGYGTRSKAGEVVDETEADRRLRAELTGHANNVDKAAGRHGYKLTAPQRDALISFDFNTGSAAEVLSNAKGDPANVAERMSRYIHAGGKVNKGLINRRSRELEVFRSTGGPAPKFDEFGGRLIDESTPERDEFGGILLPDTAAPADDSWQWLPKESVSVAGYAVEIPKRMALGAVDAGVSQVRGLGRAMNDAGSNAQSVLQGDAARQSMGSALAAERSYPGFKFFDPDTRAISTRPNSAAAVPVLPDGEGFRPAVLEFEQWQKTQAQGNAARERSNALAEGLIQAPLRTFDIREQLVDPRLMAQDLAQRVSTLRGPGADLAQGAETFGKDARAAVNPDPRFDGTIFSQVFENAGQLPVTVLEGAINPALMVAGGAAQIYDQGHEDARASIEARRRNGEQITDEEEAQLRQLTAVMSMPAAALESGSDLATLGVVSGALRAARQGGGKALRNIATNTGRQMLIETPTEVGQQLIQNNAALESGADPTRELSQDLARTAVVTPLATMFGGGMINSGAEFIGSRQANQGANPTAEGDPATMLVAPSDGPQDLADITLGPEFTETGADPFAPNAAPLDDSRFAPPPEVSQQNTPTAPSRDDLQFAAYEQGYPRPVIDAMSDEELTAVVTARTPYTPAAAQQTPPAPSSSWTYKEDGSWITRNNDQALVETALAKAEADGLTATVEQQPDGNFTVRTRLPATPEAIAEQEAAAQAQREMEEELTSIRNEGTFGLGEVLRAVGGLPSRKSPNFEGASGELGMLIEARRGVRQQSGNQRLHENLFTDDAQDLDTIAESLREKGFNTQTPYDVIELVDQWLRTGIEPRAAINATNGNEDAPFAQTTTRAPQGSSAQAVETVARETVSAWDQQPEIRVFDSIEQIPEEAVRAQAKAANGRVEGFHRWIRDGRGGRRSQVTLIAGNLTTPARAAELILHETVGHGGLQTLFKGKLKNSYHSITEGVWQRLKNSRVDDAFSQKQGYRTLAELAARYGFDTTTESGRANLVEEHLARLAESNQRPTWLQTVIAKIRSLIRQIGPVFRNYNESDILALLTQARQAVGADSGGIQGGTSFAVAEDDGPAGMSISLGRTEVQRTAETRVFQTANGGVIGPASFAIRAFHGTPHKVDKFSTDYMGTGEGAQAYGWGLYFAENEAVAEEYREQLTSSLFNDADATSQAPIQAKPGYTYAVELDAEQDDMLDFDRPLSEQSPKVQALLEPFRKAVEADWASNPTLGTPEVVGQVIAGYEIIAGSAKAVSQALMAAGIPGIRFLDQGSRDPQILFDGQPIPKGNLIAELAAEKLDLHGAPDLAIASFESDPHAYTRPRSLQAAELIRQGRIKIVQPQGTYNFVIFDDSVIRITDENGQPVDTGTSFAIAPEPSSPQQRRQFITSVQNTAAVAPEIRERIESVYTPITNEQTVFQAKARINSVGLDKAIAEVLATNPSNPPTALTNAIAIELLHRLGAMSRFDEAGTIAEHVAAQATTQGQAIQALAMLGALTPEGIQVYAHKIINRELTNDPDPEKVKMLEEINHLKEQLKKATKKNGTDAILDIQDLLKSLNLTPERLSELQVRLREILIQSGNEPGTARDRLVGMIMGAGMDRAKATALANKALKKFQARAKAARDKMLREMLKVPAAKLRIPKGDLLKWLALNDSGALNDAKFYSDIAKKMGLPIFTSADAAKLRSLAEAYKRAINPEIKLLKGAEMMDYVHSLIPTTIASKARTLQTMAMLLGRPLVAIRNVLGNTMQLVASATADGVNAYVIDPMVGVVTGNRTIRSISLAQRREGFGQPLRDYRAGMAEAMAQTGKATYKDGMAAMIGLAKLTSRGVQSAADLRRTHGYTFSSAFMRTLEDGMTLQLSVTDRAFWQAAYLADLHRQMDVAAAAGTPMVAPDAAMIETALLAAQRATFQNPNVITAMLKKIEKLLNLPRKDKNGNFVWDRQYGVGSAVVAFSQVPGSIGVQGAWDFSPLGFIGAATELIAPLRGRGFDQRAFNDKLSRALVGTVGLAGVGFWLASLGIMTGLPEEDPELEAMRLKAGLGKFRLNVSALKRAVLGMNWFTRQQRQEGDIVMSYDWAQPVAIPLAMGAEMNHQIEVSGRQAAFDKAPRGLAAKSLSNLGAAGSAILGGVRTLETLPMLSGLNNFFNEVSREDGWIAGTAKTALNIPANFVPGALADINKMFDNQTRETRGGNALERAIARVATKVPGWAQQYPPRFDLFGEAQEKYQYGTNSLVNILLNPAFTTRARNDANIVEIERLFEATGQTSVLPRKVDTKVNIRTSPMGKAESLELTNEQISDYQRMVGQLSRDAALTLAASPVFANLPEERKATIYAQQLSDINEAAKMELFNQSVVLVSPGGQVTVNPRAIFFRNTARRLGYTPSPTPAP